MAAIIGGREFRWGERVYVMGIINTTPDSFSGDGFGHDAVAAIARGVQMVGEGADVLDVGGESSRPPHTYGPEARPVSVAEELSRVLPVVEGLVTQASIPVSIDTSKLEVASAAVAAGASMINDVWGLQRSPALADLAARHGLGLVVMHNQPTTDYLDLLGNIRGRLVEGTRIALAAGVAPERILVDPGIGFGKTMTHNLEVLQRLEELTDLGFPILVGTSRKNFIGRILDLPPQDRVEGTAATVAAAVLRGAAMVRVHDVREMSRVVRVAERLR